MTAVDEARELDALGASVVEERLDRGPDRAAGVEDVVDEHAGHPLEREVERRRADERLRVQRRIAAAQLDVVAVEGDVEGAELDLFVGSLGDQTAQTMRERDASRVDPDEREPVELRVRLDQ